jgi:hypothetical protein
MEVWDLLSQDPKADRNVVAEVGQRSCRSPFLARRWSLVRRPFLLVAIGVRIDLFAFWLTSSDLVPPRVYSGWYPETLHCCDGRGPRAHDAGRVLGSSLSFPPPLASASIHETPLACLRSELRILNPSCFVICLLPCVWIWFRRTRRSRWKPTRDVGFLRSSSDLFSPPLVPTSYFIVSSSLLSLSYDLEAFLPGFTREKSLLRTRSEARASSKAGCQPS